MFYFYLHDLRAYLLLLFMISLASFGVVHAQTNEIAVTWMIEGPPNEKLQANKPVGDDAGHISLYSNDTIWIEVAGIEPAPDTEYKYDYFVTGNEYARDGYKIMIHSTEGQILNEAIIEQRELQTENFGHKIRYYDRFSDGYVEIAEALLDPLSEQKYFISGSTYDYNINSNLELYVAERGYSLDNLVAVPNDVFSPKQFTYGRSAHQESRVTGEAVGDLRGYSPNYAILDEAELAQRMMESFSGQVDYILDSVLAVPVLEPQSPELYTITSGSLTDVKHAGTDEADAVDTVTGDIPESAVDAARPDLFDAIRYDQPRFEDTGHIRLAMMTEDNAVWQGEPEESLPDREKPFGNILLLAAAVSVVGLAAWGLYWRKGRAVNAPPIPVLHAGATLIQRPLATLDVDIAVKKMIADAQDLHNAGYRKEAHEALGRTIRFFYSYKMGLTGQMTNTELLDHIRDRIPVEEYTSVKRWLVMCGSVEYAKYRSNATDFFDMVRELSDRIGV